jgi:hypothetical protein
VTIPLGVPHPTAWYAGGYREIFKMSDVEEELYGPPDSNANDIDNGNVALRLLLHDDDSLLTVENQQISRAVRDCTHQQFRQIAQSDSEDES